MLHALIVVLPLPLALFGCGPRTPTEPAPASPSEAPARPPEPGLLPGVAVLTTPPMTGPILLHASESALIAFDTATGASVVLDPTAGSYSRGVGGRNGEAWVKANDGALRIRRDGDHLQVDRFSGDFRAVSDDGKRVFLVCPSGSGMCVATVDGMALLNPKYVETGLEMPTVVAFPRADLLVVYDFSGDMVVNAGDPAVDVEFRRIARAKKADNGAFMSADGAAVGWLESVDDTHGRLTWAPVVEGGTAPASMVIETAYASNCVTAVGATLCTRKLEDGMRIVALDPSTGKLTELATDALLPDPVPSPDGKQIAYAAEEGGKNHVFLVPITGGARTSVASGDVWAVAWVK